MEIAVCFVDFRINPSVRAVGAFDRSALFYDFRETSVVSDFIAVSVEFVAHAFVDAKAVERNDCASRGSPPNDGVAWIVPGESAVFVCGN